MTIEMPVDELEHARASEPSKDARYPQLERMVILYERYGCKSLAARDLDASIAGYQLMRRLLGFARGGRKLGGIFVLLHQLEQKSIHAPVAGGFVSLGIYALAQACGDEAPRSFEYARTTIQTVIARGQRPTKVASDEAYEFASKLVSDFLGAS